MRAGLRSVAAGAMQRARARGLTIPRCAADRDEALALIRKYHEQWLREGAPMEEPAVGSGQFAPQNGS